MKLLIETSKSILRNTQSYLGDYKISKQLIQLCLKTPNTEIILLSDELEKNYTLLKTTSLYKNCIFTNYSNLSKTIISNNFIPDIAFNPTLNINNLLHWRNNFKYHFPIIGLIHGIHKYKDLENLQDSKTYMTEHDSFICPSADTKDVLLKIGFKKNQITVISYGVNSTKFKPINNKYELRKKNKINSEKTVLLILSRVSPELKSDLTPLFRLIPQIKNHSNLLIYIVGHVSNESYVNELKNFAKISNIDHLIKWNHFPDHKNIHEYFQLSDIFLSLSDFYGESFGLTVQEAMATGLPTILSEFSGYKTHLTNQVEGFYIPTITTKTNLNNEFYYGAQNEFGHTFSQTIAMDYRKLIDSINSLIKSNSLREQMGKKAREKIKKNYTLTHMINSYIGFFNTQIEKSKKIKKLKPQNYKTVFELLSHQTTSILKENTKLELTQLSKTKINKNEPFLLSINNTTYFDLTNEITQLLYKNIVNLKDLCEKINQPKNKIIQNCLFLLKQRVIKLVQ
jgi:glycosyltransferase involved in cell wall biosynthesis